MYLRKRMVRALREDERDEIEALRYLVKYINTKPNVEAFRVWEAVLEVERIATKYILTGIMSQQELSELIDIDDMKDLLSRLMDKIRNHLETGETK